MSAAHAEGESRHWNELNELNHHLHLCTSLERVISRRHRRKHWHSQSEWSGPLVLREWQEGDSECKRWTMMASYIEQWERRWTFAADKWTREEGERARGSISVQICILAVGKWNHRALQVTDNRRGSYCDIRVTRERGREREHALVCLFQETVDGRVGESSALWYIVSWKYNYFYSRKQWAIDSCRYNSWVNGRY